MAADFRLHAPADITPLQVWNTPLSATDPTPLWQVLRAESFANFRPRQRVYKLADAIVRASTAILQEAFARGALRPSRAAPQYLCAQICVYGGLAATANLRDGFMFRSDARVAISTTPRDYLRMLAKCMFRRAPVLTCDVGQTSIKMHLLNGTRVELARKKYVPLGAECDPDVATHFIGCALKQLVASAPPRTPLMLALPWPLDTSLVPGESTYKVDKRATFMQEISDLAGFAPHTQVTVANDAVFAAECARIEKPLLGNTLALTLGHGPGAAFLNE